MPKGQIISINVSSGGIPKLPKPRISVGIGGLEGDGHNHEKHRVVHQAVCLQDIEKLEELKSEGYSLPPGATGENLTVQYLNVNKLPLGTVLRFANGVMLELTKVRKPCYVLDSINPRLKTDIEGRCGIYARVLQEGIFTQGETIEIISR